MRIERKNWSEWMEDKRIESIIERVKPEAKEIKERSWGDEKIRKGIIKSIDKWIKDELEIVIQ